MARGGMAGRSLAKDNGDLPGGRKKVEVYESGTAGEGFCSTRSN